MRTFSLLAIVAVATLGLSALAAGSSMPHSTLPPASNLAMIAAPNKAAPTFTVTHTEYTTLVVGTGVQTFNQSSGAIDPPLTPGSGGEIAVYCGKDKLPTSCATGTASGSSFSILVNVSTKVCKDAMKDCRTLTCQIVGSYRFEIDKPGTLAVAEIDFMGVTELAAGAVYAFPVAVQQAVPEERAVLLGSPSGAAGGTIGSLPPKVALTPIPYDGFVTVAMTNERGEPIPSLAPQQVPISRGFGVLLLDLSGVANSNKLVLRVDGLLLDTSVANIPIRGN